MLSLKYKSNINMNFLELQFTHNLNILILDDKFNIIHNKSLLEDIYYEFVDKIIIKNAILFDNKTEIHLYWKKIVLNEMQNKFMGNLFIKSAYSDIVLYSATKFLLNEIENKLKKRTVNKNWKIEFYISKLLEHMHNVYEFIIN